MPSNTDLTLEAIFGLKGKVALVTGGGSGIGLMIAKGLATNGATTYIGGRRRAVLEKVAAEFDNGSTGRIIPIELDVTSKESILRAVEVIGSANEGKLDILVNNAGQEGPMIPPFFKDPAAPERASASTLGKALFENEGFEDWASLFDINISSLYFVTIAFLGLLDKASQEDAPFSASVVNITSISGSFKLSQSHFAYNTSKAAGDHLTKMLATELALKNVKVRVNAIAPGLFATEMTKKEGLEFGAEETTSFSGSLHPVPSGRSGTAEEIAGSAIYLVSLAGRYTNGQVLVVDGSLLAVNPSTV